jgi:RES domain-containing protein
VDVYRITSSQWSDQLVASGYPARWNSMGVYTIYTASTRSLACLENLVHLDIASLQKLFRVCVIHVPDEISIENIDAGQLPKNWFMTEPEGYACCQPIGDKWNLENKTVLLKVPSAIIKNEYNYLINPRHNDFNKLKISSTEPFLFDGRLR